MDCLFCKIIAGELPANIVYEDDKSIAFLDIAPVNPGHVLIVPREHHADIIETPPALAAHLLHVVQKIAPVIVTAVEADGFNVGINTGAAAGQSVFHTHLHLMPRHAHDGYEHWHGEVYKDGEAAKLAERLRKVIEK